MVPENQSVRREGEGRGGGGSWLAVDGGAERKGRGGEGRGGEGERESQN